MIGQQKRKAPKHVADYLRSVKARKGSVTVSTMGSSVTFGTGATSYASCWSGLLQSYLQSSPRLSSLVYNNNGYPGEATSYVISGSPSPLTNVIGQSPDLVIFESMTLNDPDTVKNPGGIETTKSNLLTIMNTIKAQLPQTRAIIIPPNQKTNGNSTYLPYMAQVRTFINEHRWEYYDHWSRFDYYRNKDSVTLTSCLDPDGVHPNDTGYNYWFLALRDLFMAT